MQAKLVVNSVKICLMIKKLLIIFYKIQTKARNRSPESTCSLLKIKTAKFLLTT